MTSKNHLKEQRWGTYADWLGKTIII